MSSSWIDSVVSQLDDVDYPVTKDELISSAKRRGVTHDLMRALRALPPVEYANREELLRALPAPDERPAAVRAAQSKKPGHPRLAERSRALDDQVE
jgi:hypothetical protein